METWQNATTGKFGWVELKERYKEIQLPEIIPVDIKELHRKKRMTGQFSPLLLQYVREALDNKTAGDSVSESPGICSDDRVPHVRMGAKVQEL